MKLASEGNNISGISYLKQSDKAPQRPHYYQIIHENKKDLQI